MLPRTSTESFGWKRKRINEENNVYGEKILQEEFDTYWMMLLKPNSFDIKFTY